MWRMISMVTATSYLCDVKNVVDRDHQGRLFVQNEELNGAYPFWAEGSTPFGGHGAGMVHIPPPGTQVLVTAAIAKDKTIRYFWTACPFVPTITSNDKGEADADSPEDTGLKAANSMPESDSVYRVNGYPDKYIWRSELGHKVELSDKVAQDGSKTTVQENHTLLETPQGRRILLDDGVGGDFQRIILDDNKGNFIRIQTQDDGVLGENSIQVECGGNIHITAKTGKMLLNVASESEEPIQIINDGKGDVLVDCKQGNVTVNAKKDIDLTSEEDITIKADKDINITADGNIKLDATRIDLN